MEISGGNLFDEPRVPHSIEGFADIDTDRDCSTRRFIFVESGGDFVHKRQKSRRCRVKRLKTVLSRIRG